jgi:hypothetical protein
VPDQRARYRVGHDPLKYLDRIGDVDRSSSVGPDFPGDQEQRRQADAAGRDRVVPPSDARGLGKIECGIVSRH